MNQCDGKAVRFVSRFDYGPGWLGRGQGSDRLLQGADAAAEGSRIRQGAGKDLRDGAIQPRQDSQSRLFCRTASKIGVSVPRTPRSQGSRTLPRGDGKAAFVRHHVRSAQPEGARLRTAGGHDGRRQGWQRVYGHNYAVGQFAISAQVRGTSILRHPQQVLSARPFAAGCNGSAMSTQTSLGRFPAGRGRPSMVRDW